MSSQTDDRLSVMIAIPNMGWIHKDVVAKVFLILQDPRVKSTLMMPTNIPYENNRAKITEDFLKSDGDYLITIDDDNPPTKNPIDLVFLGLDVIGLPTPVWHFTGDYDNCPFYINAMDEAPGGWTEHKDKNGLQEVDAVGSGCMILSRTVLRSLEFKQPWMRTWNKKGIVDCGCDFTFCKKAKEAGFKIYTHYDYLCRHYKEMEISEAVNAMGSYMNKALNPQE